METTDGQNARRTHRLQACVTQGQMRLTVGKYWR